MSEPWTEGALMRKRGSTFALAARFLGEAQSTLVARLYAVCRALDDLADHPGGQQDRCRLGVVRSELLARQADDPLAKELMALEQNAAVDLAPAVELVGGLAGDRGSVRVGDEHELLSYAYAVAGTVGLMMAQMLGARCQAARVHARDLGIAMQLTNIARDVVEDARLGRRYLPETWAPFTPEEITSTNAEVRRQCAGAVLDILSLADRFYASGLGGLPYLPFRARCAVSVATAVYREIGVMLRERDGRYWEGRVVVPQGRRVAVALRAVARTVRVKTPAVTRTDSASFALVASTKPHERVGHDRA